MTEYTVRVEWQMFGYITVEKASAKKKVQKMIDEGEFEAESEEMIESSEEIIDVT